MIKIFRFILIVIYSMYAHTFRAKSKKKSVRYWDRTTPYFIHPLWCAMTLLTETALPSKIRYEGAVGLLLHDVKEDTKSRLPFFLTKSEEQIVLDMTFLSSEEEKTLIWDKPIEVRLYKLYDKTSNLLDSSWMTREKKRWYEEYTKELMDDVEQNYGLLNIVKISQAIIN